ncbi:MAG: serine hydrolase [Anaerolineae bacterium]
MATQRLVPAGLEAYIEQARQDWGAPGVAIAVVRDDVVVFARGFGVRELGKDGPVDEHTLFAVASTTKAFTAALLGMLVDEGRLKWDDPVTSYLPGFQLYDPFVTRELTVRDLLCHRSGLSRGDSLWYATGFDRAEVLHRVRHLKPSWSFRARYGYQNIMYLAASQVIEAVAGQSWDDFIEARLLAPLGMTRSVTSVHELAGMENVATPHHQDEDSGDVTPIPYWDVDNIAGAGALNASAVEMAQWMRLNLAGGLYEGTRLLSEDVIREMQTPQMINNDPERREIEAKIDIGVNFNTYGLGWAVYDYQGRKVIAHGGGLDGMRSEVMMAPAEKLGVVVLTNLTRVGAYLPNAIAYRTLDAYLGNPERDWSRDYLKAAGEMAAEQKAEEEKIVGAHVEGTAPSLPLAAYTGTYRNAMYGDAEIAQEGDALVLKFYRLVGDLAHWHYDTFRIHWRNPGMDKAYAVFTLNVKGQAETLKWEGIPEPIAFTRADAAEADEAARASDA